MNNSKTPVQRFISFYEKFGILFILLFEIIIFSFSNNNFLTPTNLLLVGRQVSFYGIAAVGMTMVLLLGEIDISGGAILALSGCFAAFLTVKHGMPLFPAFLIVLALCAVFGLISGSMTSYLKIPSLIGTLAMQIIIKGVTYLMTGAAAISGISDHFKFLGQGFVASVVPIPLVIMIVTFALGFIVLNRTYIGRRIYSVGGNKDAARLSGIKTRKVLIGTFVVSAVLSGVAGILMAARIGTGQPTVGSDFSMDVLTATVLGGVTLQGGKGSVLNVLVGAFIIGILSNGLVMSGILEYWQWIIKGLVFVFAVAMSNIHELSSKK